MHLPGKVTSCMLQGYRQIDLWVHHQALSVKALHAQNCLRKKALMGLIAAFVTSANLATPPLTLLVAWPRALLLPAFLLHTLLRALCSKGTILLCTTLSSFFSMLSMALELSR